MVSGDRAQHLNDYRRRLLDHREVDVKLRKCEYLSR